MGRSAPSMPQNVFPVENDAWMLGTPTFSSLIRRVAPLISSDNESSLL
jgi:hypothetical protein